MKRPSFLALILLVSAGLENAAAAEPLFDAIENQVKANRASAEAQQDIDKLSDQTRKMLEEYREALRRTEALNAYNAHLRRLVESQTAEQLSLEKQLADIDVTRRDIVPLMLRMEEALQSFVQLDRPFLPDERSRRMAELKDLMVRAGVNDAEKFRRLIEAYQIENEYGKTIEAYRAELKNGDSANARTVDFLRIGRVALFYQSLDGRETGVWNQKTRHWQVLPSEYNKGVRKGLAIARKEMAPELLPIAVEPPEVLP